MHLPNLLAHATPHTPKPDFNLSAFMVCMVVVALVVWMAFRWIINPETRTRGLIVLAIIVIPTIISGLGILLRLVI